MAIPFSTIKTRNGDAEQLLLEAEQAILAPKGKDYTRAQWLEFLDVSRKPAFLQALGTDARRNDWAELVGKVLQKLDFTLRDLLEQRVAEHPRRVLFMDMSPAAPAEWTYEQIWHH